MEFSLALDRPTRPRFSPRSVNTGAAAPVWIRQVERPPEAVSEGAWYRFSEVLRALRPEVRAGVERHGIELTSLNLELCRQAGADYPGIEEEVRSMSLAQAAVNIAGEWADPSLKALGCAAAEYMESRTEHLHRVYPREHAAIARYMSDMAWRLAGFEDPRRRLWRQAGVLSGRTLRASCWACLFCAEPELESADPDERARYRGAAAVHRWTLSQIAASREQIVSLGQLRRWTELYLQCRPVYLKLRER